MASLAEQPPKKRKLFEETPSELEPVPSQSPPENDVVSSPSHEEILKKRKNRDEIRGVYECYKRIKFCLSHKRDSELEQAYISLISASRGCASVQRIVADLIPRYASYCPTAFEAAAKVVINIHNWSLEAMNTGEDVDGVAFHTARSCVLGLSDICCTACSEATNSTVIREICSAVLQNVLIFFISSFEGKDIFQVFGKEIVKIQDSADKLFELKQTNSDENESPLIVLLKLRVLSLFRIFFRYPKSLLAACFDLFGSTNLEGIRKGLIFLSQLSRTFDVDEVHKDDKLSSGAETLSREAPPESGSCFLALVLIKDPSLRSWIASKFKRISQLSSSKMFSEIKSVMESVVESAAEVVGVGDSQVDNDIQESNLSESSNHSNLKRSQSYQHETSKASSCPTKNTRVRGGSYDDVAERVSRHYSGTRSEAQDSSVSVTMDIGVGQHGETEHVRSSNPRDPMNVQIPSPSTRVSSEFRSNSFDGRNQVVHVDRNLDFRSPTWRSSTEGSSNPFVSPKHHLASTQIIWHSDGDPATVDIFSASKQLWVGLLGPDTSDAHVKYEFERFGPIEQYFSFPAKGFCVVDYRNILDAVKARDYLRRHFHWHIKFMDTGLGTRGVMNNVAVGASCLVYVGSVSNQWEKDEILHESRRVLYGGPSLITDLKNEGALLMELETPEEAAAVMAHLRHYRNERSINTMSHGDNGNNHHENVFYNNARASSDTNMVLESPADGSWGRMSPLSSLLLSLRAKYNVNQNLSYFENFLPGNFHSSMREEEKGPSSTVTISVPNINSSFLSDDEVMAICNIAIGNTGSVNRLARTNSQNGCTWYVECSSVDAAMAVLNNLRRHPEIFFQIEFSQQHLLHSTSFSGRTDSMELISPRYASESHIAGTQGGHSFHLNRTTSDHSEMFEAGPANVDGIDTTVMVDPSHGGTHGVSSAMEQNWVYPNSEMDPPPPPGIQVATHGPPPIQSYQYMQQQAYVPPNSSWDPSGLHQNFPLNPTPYECDYKFTNTVQASFLAASMYSMPPPPPLAPLPPPPPPPDVPPPPPSSPPPPPPPPPPTTESYQSENSEQSQPSQWQGLLCKSGVHYCSIYALRLASDVCKYSSSTPEPTEWPAKLDMTKRTDFRHIQLTFHNTPPHKREVCMLVPSSPNDHKGFQDFISYLKQRECAGVIKIPPSRSIWSRLLFILPYSHDLCSMLSISQPATSDCLVALLLPKETNFEWV